MIISKKDFEELGSKTDLSNLYYSEYKNYLWQDALYLGSFTDSKGFNYDLGVKRSITDKVSLYAICDNTPGAWITMNLHSDEELVKATLELCNQHKEFSNEKPIKYILSSDNNWFTSSSYDSKPSIQELRTSISYGHKSLFGHLSDFQLRILLCTGKLKSKGIEYKLYTYDHSNEKHEDVPFEFSITIVNKKYNNSIEHRALVGALKAAIDHYTSIKKLPCTKQSLCSIIQKLCKIRIETELNMDSVTTAEILKINLGIDSYMYTIAEDQVYINDEPLINNFDPFLVNQWIIDSKSQSVIFKPLPINWIKLFNSNIRPKRWAIYKHKLIKQKL